MLSESRSTSRPLARVAALAVLGGPVSGAVGGVSFALMSSVPDWLVAPNYLGGTASIGWIVTVALIAAPIGAFFGLVVGLIVGAVLGLAWALKAPQLTVLVLGSLVVCGVLIGMVVGTFGMNGQAMMIAALGSTNGVAGVILLTWVAGLRPHDYWDVLAARERQRASGVG